MSRYAHKLPGFVVSIVIFFAISSSADAQQFKPAQPFASTGVQRLQNVDYNAHQQLERLLHPHFFFGTQVSDAVRAATGDPNISVIDRRTHTGDVYECNFQFWGARRQRVMVCD